MRVRPAILIALATSWIASGQTYTISTLAGGELPANVPGTSASLYSPISVAVDKTGNVFFGDTREFVVLRLDATTGVLTLAAGNGTAGFSGDGGPAASAQFGYTLNGVAVDSGGNLYITDRGNNRIRKVTNGVITTVAGNGAAGFGGDSGAATSAELNSPNGIAVDASGNLYIADTANNCIRKIANGVITTIAGNGTAGFGGDSGAATSAELNSPNGIAVDASGNLYIADTLNYRIRMVANGTITTVVGNGTQGFRGDNGPPTSAELNQPESIAVDASGNLYIADTLNSRIRKVANGVITTAAGNGTSGFSGDNGSATSAQLGQPWGVAVDVAGNLYIADTYINHRVRKVSNGVITTVAGNGLVGDNGPATSSQLNNPVGVALDAAGNVYMSDFYNNRIRKVSSGVITTVAGIGTPGFSGDNGLATSAQLNGPIGVAVDSAGNLYIGDGGNNRIRKVSNGVITTVAGNGTSGFSGDNGPATAAQLNGPGAVAVDAAGNLYISEQGDNRVRKVSGGVITSVAGNGTPGFSGDNGPATSAQLNLPLQIAVDAAGNVYITDEDNQRIRKVANGVITTVAGNGTAGFSGDSGPAISARLSFPQGVAVDSAGNLYVGDDGNSRIRKVSNGVIATVAGNGTPGFSGDNGPATSAELDNPREVAADPTGNLYFVDAGNNRVRLLTTSAPSCAYSLTPTSLQSSASGGSFSVAIQTTATCSWTISSLPNWITVSGCELGYRTRDNCPHRRAQYLRCSLERDYLNRWCLRYRHASQRPALLHLHQHHAAGDYFCRFGKLVRRIFIFRIRLMAGDQGRQSGRPCRPAIERRHESRPVDFGRLQWSECSHSA
jgi:sugar lactone lactonase YvrE